jgi:membrane fusion protein, heavy metal efflux system
MLKKASRLLAFPLVPAVAMAMAAAASAADAAAGAPALPRVEVRSADLWAVGVVRDDKMSIHLSRLIDNAPVRDAAISVVLRGTAHSATAESDGSYSLQTKDLTLPGPAVVEFQVGFGAARESLKGTLDIGPTAGQPDGKNNARQLWWWVLNFAVCFGVLWLISRRRKAAQT